jgi:hypothetical protein
MLSKKPLFLINNGLVSLGTVVIPVLGEVIAAFVESMDIVCNL